MPELPEVETTGLSLSTLIGQTVKRIDVHQPKLRWPVPDDLSQLVGYQFQQVTRRAKYLIATFVHAQQQPRKLLIHLGMSGSLQQRDPSSLIKHDHVVVHFADQTNALCYHDPRRFGAVLWHEDYADKLLNHLGAEPLAADFNADYLQAYCAKTSRAIKAVIMDQRCVVGVGNIYATESLFLTKIHPLTPANTVSIEHIELLVQHIKSVLNHAIELGGSTLRDYTHSDGKTGYFQQTLAVYARAGKPCSQCASTISTVKITGRASAFCPKCQQVPDI